MSLVLRKPVFGFPTRSDTVIVAKTKALISFAVTAKLICVFVFAYAKSRFSHDTAHIALVRDKKTVGISLHQQVMGRLNQHDFKSA